MDNGGMSEPANDGRTALLPGRVGLFVRLQANPGARAGLLDALHRFADQLGADPATELFVIALDPEDDDVGWVYEWFTDEQSLESHRSTQSFVELVNEVPALLAAPPGMLRIDPLRLTMQPAILDDSIDAD